MKKNFNEQMRILKSEIETTEKEIKDLENKIFLLKQTPDDNEIDMQLVKDFLLEENAKTQLQILTNGNIEEKKYNFEKFQDLIGVRGIHFTRAHNELFTRNQKSNVLRRYTLSGFSYDLQFRLQFDVYEETFTISQIKIVVSSDIKNELEAWIAKVEEEKSLRMFFTGFVQYAERFRERKELFGYFLEQYRNQVILPFGKFSSILQFRNPKSHFDFDFEWAIFFSPEAKVEQTMELYPRFSQEFFVAAKSTVNQFRQQFQSLIDLKGVETALTIFIKISFGDI